MKNILIVRQQNNQMGDLLCSLPMYFSLKEKFPESHITLVAGKTNYRIPYKQLCPAIDEIIQMDRETLTKNINFIKSLRKRKYDIGIIPSTMQFSRTSHVINILSGAKLRVGVNRFDNNKNPFSFLLNVKGDFQWHKNKVHQTKRILDIVSLIGCGATEEFVKRKLNFDSGILSEADLYLKENFPDADLIIGMHPGAGKAANRWSIANFTQTSEILYKKYKAYFLITSGNIDDEITNSLSQNLLIKNIPFKILKNAEINLLAAILSKINLYITNDTGVMHLAGFAGGKVISLFGPTNGYEWAPLFDNCIFIQSENDDINSININEVIVAAQKLI